MTHKKAQAIAKQLIDTLNQFYGYGPTARHPYESLYSHKDRIELEYVLLAYDSSLFTPEVIELFQDDGTEEVELLVQKHHLQPVYNILSRPWMPIE